MLNPICVHCLSMSNLSVRVHLNFIFSFSCCQLQQCVWWFANTIQINWKGNFEFNCFDSICQLIYQYNEVWCMKTTQMVHRNLLLHLFFHFQQTILSIALYHNMNCIAMDRDINISWPVYHDGYYNVKFLPIISPGLQGFFDQWKRGINPCKPAKTTKKQK